jgi:hypothetical protein
MLRNASTRPAVAIALALAATTALTGCGLLGGDDKGSDTGTSSPTSTGESSASSTPASGGSGGDSESEQPRPAKADVVAGLTKFYDRTDKTNSYDHGKLANCIADKGYDTFSSKTLHALKDGNPGKVEKGDAAQFGAISVACAAGSMPSGSRPPLPSIPTEIPTGIPTKLPSNFPTAPPT